MRGHLSNAIKINDLASLCGAYVPELKGANALRAHMLTESAFTIKQMGASSSDYGT